MKIDFKFQSLGKISNISAADPTVLLGQFQHWAHTEDSVVVRDVSVHHTKITPNLTYGSL